MSLWLFRWFRVGGVRVVSLMLISALGVAVLPVSAQDQGVLIPPGQSEFEACMSRQETDFTNKWRQARGFKSGYQLSFREAQELLNDVTAAQSKFYAACKNKPGSGTVPIKTPAVYDIESPGLPESTWKCVKQTNPKNPKYTHPSGMPTQPPGERVYSYKRTVVAGKPYTVDNTKSERIRIKTEIGKEHKLNLDRLSNVLTGKLAPKIKISVTSTTSFVKGIPKPQALITSELHYFDDRPVLRGPDGNRVLAGTLTAKEKRDYPDIVGFSNGSVFDDKCFDLSALYKASCFSKARLIRFYGTKANPTRYVIMSEIYPIPRTVSSDSLKRNDPTSDSIHNCKPKGYAIWWRMPYPPDHPSTNVGSKQDANLWEWLYDNNHVTVGSDYGLVIPKAENYDGQNALGLASDEVWLFECVGNQGPGRPCSSYKTVRDPSNNKKVWESLPPPAGTGCLQTDNQSGNLTDPDPLVLEMHAEWLEERLAEREKHLDSLLGSGSSTLSATGKRMLVNRTMNLPVSTPRLSNPTGRSVVWFTGASGTPANYPDGLGCSSGWDFYSAQHYSQGQTVPSVDTDPVFGSCVVPIYQKVVQRDNKDRTSVNQYPDSVRFDAETLDLYGMNQLSVSFRNRPEHKGLESYLDAYEAVTQQLINDPADRAEFRQVVTDTNMYEAGLAAGFHHNKSWKRNPSPTIAWNANTGIPCVYGDETFVTTANNVPPPTKTINYTTRVINSMSITVGVQHAGGELTFHDTDPNDFTLDVTLEVYNPVTQQTNTEACGIGIGTGKWCEVTDVTYDPQLYETDDFTPSAAQLYPGNVCSGPNAGCDYAIGKNPAYGNSFTDPSTLGFVARMWFFKPTEDSKSLVLDVNPNLTARTKYWKQETYYVHYQRCTWVTNPPSPGYQYCYTVSKQKTRWVVDQWKIVRTGDPDFKSESCGDLFKVASRRLTDSAGPDPGATLSPGPAQTDLCFTH